jgi:hypothetical protein
MLIPLINPSRTRRRNPLIIKKGQEHTGKAYEKYVKNRIRSSRVLKGAHIPLTASMIDKAWARISKRSTIGVFRSRVKNPCGSRRKNPVSYYGEKYPRFIKGKAPGEVVIKGSDLLSYNYFRGKGYKTLWSGEGKISLKRPAKRGISHSQQEGSMVYSLKGRRPRRVRRARHNSAKSRSVWKKLQRSTLGTFTGTKKRKASRRRALRRGTRRPRYGQHRPLLTYTKHRGWLRPRRSKLFRKPTRINPRRSRRHYRSDRFPRDAGDLQISGTDG